MDYVLDGADATVAAKLWRVDPDGTRTLATRGIYRLSLAGGDAPEGTIDFQLFGNALEFQKEQSIHLELSQTDYPYFRPSNTVSTITFSSPELRLPIVE